MNPTLVKAIVAASAVALLASGCIVVRSASKSVRAISGSSSDLASMSPLDQLYSSDLQTATCLVAAAGASPEQFRRMISTIAADHGITDWEHAPATYHGIGLGLHAAGYTATDAAAPAFLQGLLNTAHTPEAIPAAHAP